MKSRNLLIAIPGILLAMTVMASGKHAGGHDDEAIGKPGVASKVTRTVNVDMKDDMRFHSSNFDVKQGKLSALLPKTLVRSSTRWFWAPKRNSRNTTK